jgi:hypothetical protein
MGVTVKKGCTITTTPSTDQGDPEEQQHLPCMLLSFENGRCITSFTGIHAKHHKKSLTTSGAGVHRPAG